MPIGSIEHMNKVYSTISLERKIDPELIWTDSDELNKLRTKLFELGNQQIDITLLEELKRMLKDDSIQSDEKKTIEIIKGGFEKHFQMSLETFLKIREDLIQNHPEKII
jgi:urease accessory protein UreE